LGVHCHGKNVIDGRRGVIGAGLGQENRTGRRVAGDLRKYRLCAPISKWSESAGLKMRFSSSFFFGTFTKIFSYLLPSVFFPVFKT